MQLLHLQQELTGTTRHNLVINLINLIYDGKIKQENFIGCFYIVWKGSGH